MSRQAVILAGGLATRLGHLARDRPKSLVEVAGRPFIDRQLARLRDCGFDRVVLCVGHLGDQLRAHVGDGSALGLTVAYSEDGPTLRGTGGALGSALPLLDAEFLVTYGDSWLPFDYAAPLQMLREHADCDGVMSVFENEGRWDTSNVRVDGAWVSEYRKGMDPQAFRFIDYGAFALRRTAVALLPANAPSLDPFLESLAFRRRLRAFFATDRFYEIGSLEGLATLEQHLGQA